MEKNIKENAGFYSMGIIAIIIAVLGITANTVYAHSGGYALGAGLVAVAFLFECFVFAISPKLAKTRTKGILFFTAYILTIYVILFIFGDLASVKVYQSVYTKGVYESKLQPLGVFALIFEISCLILTVFFIARMILNLFGKEFKLYEKILGTTVLRYKERECVEIDIPQKDTDKLIASAKRSLGHDDKLTNALENAKTEEFDGKHKPSNIPDRIENPPKEKKKNSPKTDAVDGKDNSVKSEDSKDEKLEITENVPELNDDYDNFSCSDEEDISLAEKLFATSDSDALNEENTSYEANENEENTESEENEKIYVDSLDSEVVVTENYSQNKIEDDTHSQEEIVSENEMQESFENYDISGTGELYADTHDVGGVLTDAEIHADVRKDGISNRITDQVENPDDDIYALFDYDSDDDE